MQGFSGWGRVLAAMALVVAASGGQTQAPAPAVTYPVAPPWRIFSTPLNAGPSPLAPLPPAPTVTAEAPRRAAAPVEVVSQAAPLVVSAASAPPGVASLAWPSSPPPDSVGYRLAAGDLVRITVYQNPDLTIETRLTETGTLSYPLVGSLRLGGLGIAAAERLVAEALRQGQFVRQPQVAITVLEVRGHQASVLGQVNRPGRYPIEVTTLRLTDLLAMAGGTAPSGAERIVVTGLREGRPFRAEVDLPLLFGPDGRERDLFIRHGDAVWVDRQPQLYIYGEVQRPGVLRLERGMTLMQALATGGGLTARGTDKGIRVHRRGADGRMTVLRPGMHEPVVEGDVVHVPESLF